MTAKVLPLHRYFCPRCGGPLHWRIYKRLLSGSIYAWRCEPCSQWWIEEIGPSEEDA